jgi:hypothetical protein
VLTRRQRLHWWLIEARLPRERRVAARAERRREMAEHPADSAQRLAERGRAEGERLHSLGADFHRD